MGSVITYNQIGLDLEGKGILWDPQPKVLEEI